MTRLTIGRTYKDLWAVMQLPNMKWLSVILLTSRIAFSACDAVVPLKLLEKGFFFFV